MKKEKRKGVNQWQEVLNILLHNPNAIIGFVIVAVPRIPFCRSRSDRSYGDRFYSRLLRWMGR